MSDSEIILHKGGGFTLAGRDAAELMRASMLASSIKMYVETGGRLIPTRGVGITKMLTLAQRYTGRTYKRKEAMQAVADIGVWLETMKSALPVTDNR